MANLISTLPGVYYSENVGYELSGTGSKIPVIIGVTGNTAKDDYKIDGSQVLKFTSKDDALKPVNTNDPEDGGIGGYDDNNNIISTNRLVVFIDEFYDESRLLQSNDIGVSYIYVIDVGDGSNLSAWQKASDVAKTYFGFKCIF